MRRRVNAKQLRQSYHVWGYIGERFSIYLSKRLSKPPIGIWRGKSGALFFVLFHLKAIYISRSEWEMGSN